MKNVNKLAKTNNDNRMSWIRNIEKLKNNNSGSYYIEYEIASECYILGLLNFENEMILCSLLSIEKDKNGLHHYILKIKYAGFEEESFQLNEQSYKELKKNRIPKDILCRLDNIKNHIYKDENDFVEAIEKEVGPEQTVKYKSDILKVAWKEPLYYNKQADKKGYFFKDGILGELLAIFSVYFQCRFYLIASYHGELTSHGRKIKLENKFIYQPCNPCIHPTIFSSNNKNLANGLRDFLESIKLLDIKYHQQFILACDHYAKALKEVGIDSEMVFIRLVSSTEALSKYIELDKKNDLFAGKKFEDLIKNDTLSDEEEKELKKIYEVRKSKKRFIKFIEKYSKNFFKGGNYKGRDTKINKKNLSEVLVAIYNARSSYLHEGEPMYLSQPNSNSYNWKWDIDPGLYMIIDNRKLASKKLPYTYFFERLVRHCLLSFLTRNTNDLKA